jgi:hypothetical protein
MEVSGQLEVITADKLKTRFEILKMVLLRKHVFGNVTLLSLVELSSSNKWLTLNSPNITTSHSRRLGSSEILRLWPSGL